MTGREKHIGVVVPKKPGEKKVHAREGDEEDKERRERETGFYIRAGRERMRSISCWRDEPVNRKNKYALIFLKKNFFRYFFLG